MNFSNIDLKDLASFIYEVLKNAGIDVVLVGGACVSIYSKNRYQSADLDFVTYKELKPIEKVLEPLCSDSEQHRICNAKYTVIFAL